ncbi:hypothetical protein GSI_03319 [Ganoderma sinense ZZ0214-1]|uniref:Ricin B lectin domain-containing protein n=1 Tax=Ganoderma sinense ZZ0214-1 TaxID=1077348 RepID=A0A2G8SLA6_9APHY|nr:hypothetical protein GSI_03319 [Ganoderma sinense ZZ0214-1]
MPTLHSLSIRRRGTTRTDDSTKSSVANTVHAVYTIKSLFHRKTSSYKTSSDSDRKDTKMGNAPSDMSQGKANGAAPAGSSQKTSPELARASIISDGSSSIRSRPMPGAEPPTPVPAEPVITKDEPPKTPHMERVQVQDDANAGPAEERNLEAGVPSVGTFEVDEEVPAAQEAVPAADATRTPRPELKTEELLAPLDLTPSSPPMSTSHEPEPSDATTAVAVSPARSAKGLAGMAALPMWAPGTYVLLNARGGTAMDLHGADDTNVIGFPMHGNQNQQWEFIPSGHGYVIRCVRPSKAGHALYLTVEGGVREHAPVVASAYPVAWSVEQTEEGIRISWPNSNFVFDLADWGDSAPGTKIQLMPLIPGELCQLWHYTRCAPAERDEKGLEIEAQSARAISAPATTEAITISESHNFVTTTRTTTTTVITTVTEVTRTPKALLRQSAQQQPQPQRRSIGYM